MNRETKLIKVRVYYRAQDEKNVMHQEHFVVMVEKELRKDEDGFLDIMKRQAILMARIRGLKPESVRMIGLASVGRW